MNKKEALNIKLEGELQIDELGQEYHVYHKTLIDEGEETTVDCRLYHSLANRRLDGELQSDYRVRRHHIKNYIRTKRSGNFIWFTTNRATIERYSMTKMVAKIKQGRGEEIDDALFKLEDQKKLAMQTNMGTLNKKQLEEFAKKQEENEKA